MGAPTSSLMRLDPDAPLCPSGKRPHRTRDAAGTALAAVRASRRAGDRNGRSPHKEADRVEETACAACGWWHLASAARQRRGRRRPPGNGGRR